MSASNTDTQRWLAPLGQVRALYPAPALATDLLAWIPGFLLGALLRAEFGLVGLDWVRIAAVAALGAGLALIAGLYVGLYGSRWRTGSFPEVLALSASWCIGAGAAMIANVTLFDPRIPTSIVGFGSLIALMVMFGVRALWRLANQAARRPDADGRTRVVVFGAGEGGESVIRSMLTNPDSMYVPIAALDDNPRLRGRAIDNVQVMGDRTMIDRFKNKADVLLIAIPSADADVIEAVSNRATDAGLAVRILPGTNELFGGLVTMEQSRPIEITDLLGREEVDIDNESVSAYLEGARVLVTGAGGSIGSELCRQILRFEPATLVMIDRDETALLNVQLSIAGHGLLDDDSLVLANIRDRDRVFEIFAEHKPEIVFHAAALKHLPLLESHPREGLQTNVLGTRNLLEAAKAHDVKRFVNVSTDKAANPTSVLGTTKRLAEVLTLQAGLDDTDAEYLSVRFGNVLASRGSVVPTFEEQIRSGGPVTVTHPDVTRYFMSIPEASRLVMQAGAFGKTGETLVLDMGEPMKIVDLADKLIRHHNAKVDVVFTGLRPNEKLHEVLNADGEDMRTGPHPRIWHTDAAVWAEGGLDLSKLDAMAPDELGPYLLDVCASLGVVDLTRADARGPLA